MYTDPTVPFADPYLLQIHYVRHGHEVGATSEADYERLADAFMSQGPHPDLYDGTCLVPRADNGMCDRLRLDNATRWFGVAFGALTVRTLHMKSRFKINKHGGPRAFVDAKCLEVR